VTVWQEANAHQQADGAQQQCCKEEGGPGSLSERESDSVSEGRNPMPRLTITALRATISALHHSQPQAVFGLSGLFGVLISLSGQAVDAETESSLPSAGHQGMQPPQVVGQAHQVPLSGQARRPRSENWRKPNVSLMMPMTGSTLDLRRP
jgi:hypothetical protein